MKEKEEEEEKLCYSILIVTVMNLLLKCNEEKHNYLNSYNKRKT